mmetsp:Transcript_43967/g.42566  ORF Transcript_43967/g.42566 Transcript_43967/m.42566 type:complete len:210 (-) Transcript_43967:622-1251(-)
MDPASRHQRDVFFLKDEVRDPSEESFSDGEELLGNDGQNLHIDPIELIQTGPSPLLGQPTKQPPNHLEVNLIRAVEDDTQHPESLCKVLGAFSLARPSRPCRVRSQLNVESARDSDPAPVCERCDDQPGSSPHVLIAVFERSIDLSHSAIFNIFIPAVSELLLPPELKDRLHIFLAELIHNVPRMDVCGDKGHNDLPLEGVQLASDAFC